MLTRCFLSSIETASMSVKLSMSNMIFHFLSLPGNSCMSSLYNKIVMKDLRIMIYMPVSKIVKDDSHPNELLIVLISTSFSNQGSRAKSLSSLM